MSSVLLGSAFSVMALCLRDFVYGVIDSLPSSSPYCPFLLDRETPLYFKMYFYVKDYLYHLSIFVSSWAMCIIYSASQYM